MQTDHHDIVRDVIVIGASAGATHVMTRLASELPADFPAILIVRHIGTYPSVLPDLLAVPGRNKAKHAENGDPVSRGTILVAPPDHHMLVVEGAIRLTRGAKENRARPAIDPLFRSAAVTYGPRVIGVVLSGRLDDGTAGLQAIKACGGIAIVQEPADAVQPSMPQSAIRFAEVDEVVRGDDLAAVLQQAIRRPIIVTPRVPATVRCEHDLAAATGDEMDKLDTLGSPTRITCPDCGGVLWGVDRSRPPRYRCHTGHSYTLATLDRSQADRTDGALWTALRALQERRRVLHSLLELYGDVGHDVSEWRQEDARIGLGMEQLRSLVERTAA